MTTKKGINASPGVAIGPALVLDTEEYRIPRRTIDASQLPQQIRTLDEALKAAREEVEQVRVAATRRLGSQTADIFAYHQALLADQKLRNAIVERMQANHYAAAAAFAEEMKFRRRVFRDLTDPYLKQRELDLIDIEKKVLRYILGRAREDIRRLSEPVIIVAHDITPTQMINLDRSHVLGFAINVGGSTSHTAILARMQGIPAVVALENVTNDLSGGEIVIADGVRGLVIIDPDTDTIEQYRRRQREYRTFVQQLAEIRDLPAVTSDGTQISLMANIELAEEARYAMDAGAEGIGLYRTEFLFLSTERLPTEEQQFEIFRAAVRHARGKPVTIRTMDLGSDKMSPHLNVHHDHNPDLGLRSLRYCLGHLDMFKTHLRAILRAAAVDGNVQIMFPMIADLMELRQAKATLADVMEDLEEDGIPYARDIPVGIMVETPAAAMLASAFAKEAAFLSLGTNDLTQYTLAVDRANERVAYLYAPHNPAILRLIREVVVAGKRNKRRVNVCGEIAGSPLYCELLLGLGLRQLSMAPKDIPAIKKVIRSTSIKKCEAIARKVLKFDAARQVINYLRDNLRKMDPDAI